jgi:hypothetical protein
VGSPRLTRLRGATNPARLRRDREQTVWHIDEKGKCVTNYQRLPMPPRPATRRLGALGAASLARRVALALACVVGALGLAAIGPALAAGEQTRLFAGTFGEATSTPANPYPLEEAGSVAVDNSTHDVYVADPRNHRVEKFDAAGDFLFMLGLEVNKTAVEEAATRKAEENVCPAAGHPADVCQTGQPGASPGALIDPSFVAVDNSSGSSNGDLYVANTGAGTVNDEQTLAVSAEDGGTFELEFEGEETGPIAFNASAKGEDSVEAALSTLAKLHGAVDVSGSPGNYTINLSVKAPSVPELICRPQLSGEPACVVSANERIEKFDASGQPVTSWGEAGQLDAAGVTDPPAPVAGPFKEVHGIAVDPSGDLWVSSGIEGNIKLETVFEFHADSSFVTGWSGEVGEIAVDAANNLYFDHEGLVNKYDFSGERSGLVAPSSREDERGGYAFGISGEAVDSSTGNVYVAGSEMLLSGVSIIKQYDSSCHPVITHEVPEPGCEPVETFGAGLIQAGEHHLAIDPSTEALYVSDQRRITRFALLTVPDVLTTKPLDPTHSSASLTGTINPSGVELNAGLEGCRFEWGETAAPYEHTVPCDKSAAQIGSGSEPVEVRAVISGLQSGGTYHYRLVASNANDVNSSIQEPSIGADLAFGPPALEGASVLSLTATGVAFQAQVNPNDLDTHVRIEYGSEAGIYTESTSLEDVGSAGSSQTASFQVSGLTAGRVYHYRAVAENILGEGPELVAGPDQTFTTQASGGPLLPDERAWELVSPPDKRGATIEALSEIGVIEAAASGSAITYIADAPTEADPPSNADAAVQVLSVRTAAGWSSRDVPLPHSEPVGTPAGADASDYVFFSTELGLGLTQPKGAFNPGISLEASEEAPYLRTDFSASEPDGICDGDCYRPLVTAAAGYANVPAGTTFADGGKCLSFLNCGPQFEGATPDGSHIVLSSPAGLVEGVAAGASELYEWTAGKLQLVSTMPGSGSPAPEGASVTLGTRSSARNAISADGSRIIWSLEKSSGRHIYLSDVATGQTLQLDLNQGGSGKGNTNATFQTASSDGSVIFFTDEQGLTPGAGAATGVPDLYRCEVVANEEGELECALTDLTPANGGESAAVQGAVLGSSEDGSWVYFFAKGALSSAPNRRGEHAAPATCAGTGGGATSTAFCNLYVNHDGSTTFVAALSGTDEHDWSSLLDSKPVRVSPNGQWLAFMSQRSLTGYDNRDVASGRPAAEVYLYGAAANELRCASCDPSGARPHGVRYQELALRNIDGGGGKGTWINEGLVAANVPAWTAFKPALSRYQDRYLSDQGRLFFNTVDALVPQDSNGTLDVYEYEPSGVGSCTEATATVSPRSDGCVGLISSGTASRESVFLDASENGDDVFFLTTAQLSKRDTDTTYDVYDARVGGGEPEPVAPVECQGDACQGFVEAPNDLTPGSLIFSGPGNLTPLAPLSGNPSSRTVKCPKGERLSRGKCVKVRCPKGKKLSHGRCVRATSTHKKQARRASHERRSGS